MVSEGFVGYLESVVACYLVNIKIIVTIKLIFLFIKEGKRKGEKKGKGRKKKEKRKKASM
jgi:hypothetical protein